MRIVHEIRREAYVTASASGDPYAMPVNEKGRPAYGFRTEVLIVAVVGGDEEPIEIEGDARAIRRALVDAIAAIDTMGDHYVERGELIADWMSPDPREALPGDDQSLFARSLWQLAQNNQGKGEVP